MQRNCKIRLSAIFLITVLLISISSLGIQVRAQDNTPEANAPSNRIAYLNDDYLIVHDLDTNTHQELEGPAFYIDNVTPIEGGRLMFTFGGSLYLWDGTTAVDITPTDTLQVFNLFSSTEGRLAFVLLTDDTETYNDFKLYLWNDGEYRNLGLVPRYAVVTWSADGRLAFESNRDGNDEIYVWAEGELTNISNSPSADARPAWSADGRLAFESSRDGAADIYVWDGTTTLNVSQSEAWDEYPVWSPDGHLAFVSSSNGIRTLFVWDGSTLIDLGQADGNYVTWSDEAQLAFTSFRDGNREIYVWENGVTTNISQSAGAEWQPTWSADGRLAYISSRDAADIYVWDGSTLTSIGQAGIELTWNIDGRLAFAAMGDIFVWDGSALTNITNTPDLTEHSPHWLP